MRRAFYTFTVLPHRTHSRMSSSQDNSGVPFSAEKALRAYGVLAFLMAAMVAGAGWVQYSISAERQGLVRAVALAEQQLALTQRMEMAVAQYQATHEERYLKILKDAAGGALNNHDMLMPVMLASLPRGPNGEPAAPTPGIVAIRALIDESFTYAVSPTDAEAQARVPQMAELAIDQIPAAWNAEVAAFAAAREAHIEELEKILMVLCALILAALAWGAFGLVAPAMKQIVRQREDLERMGATDALTSSYNRAMLFKVAAGLIGSARRHKHEMTVLAVDIDGLKIINNGSGRAAGDGAIRAVAKAMGAQLRNSDAMGRVGGGEFGIFLPSTGEYHAANVAEKLRAAVEEIPYAAKDRVILLRVSIGVAQMQEEHKNPDDMLRAAEFALRRAKDGGGNRVCTWSMVTAAESKTS